MKAIVNLLFEAAFLKKIPRSGYQFLGRGRESVAEHSFLVAFVGLILAQKVPGVDTARLVSMCLLHDLPEARMGDLNYVQKVYVTPNEDQAVDDLTGSLPDDFGLKELTHEFRAGKTTEARLAHDADQLAFLLELKVLADQGYRPARKWFPHVMQRIRTEIGQDLAQTIEAADSDAWWLKNIIDRAPIKN
jgi:putative hydrolase of HD superfamily